MENWQMAKIEEENYTKVSKEITEMVNKTKAKRYFKICNATIGLVLDDGTMKIPDASSYNVSLTKEQAIEYAKWILSQYSEA